MPELTVDNLKVGDYLRFRSLNPKDLNTWEGRILSICGYEEAISQADILPYYWETKKSIKYLAIPEELKYIKLKVIENDNTSQVTYRVFALEFIDLSTLQINNYRNDVTVKIYGVENTEISSILLLLRAHGYNSKVIS